MQQTLGKCRAIKLSIDRNWMLAAAKRNHMLVRTAHAFMMGSPRPLCSLLCVTLYRHRYRCLHLFASNVFLYIVIFLFVLSFFISWPREKNIPRKKKKKNCLALLCTYGHAILYKLTERRDRATTTTIKTKTEHFHSETISHTEGNGRRRRRGMNAREWLVHKYTVRLEGFCGSINMCTKFTLNTAFASSSFSHIRRLFVCS